MTPFTNLKNSVSHATTERLLSAVGSGAHCGVVLTGESGAGKSKEVLLPLLSEVRRFGRVVVSISMPESSIDIEAHLFGKLREGCDNQIHGKNKKLCEEIRQLDRLYFVLRKLLQKNALVVIDDFQHALDDKGHPFEPLAKMLGEIAEGVFGRGCLLLVSNREVDPIWTQPFSTDHLDRPSAEEAVRIILDEISADVREANLPAYRHREVADRLGRNRRALRLLGRMLNTHPIEVLLGPPDPLAAPLDSELVHKVEVALVEKAVQGLPEAARIALRNLSVLSDWSETGLVQTVTGINGPLDKDDLMTRLHARYLVESQGVGLPGKRVTLYRAHPAFREIDRVRLHDEGDTWRAAHLRAGSWFADGLTPGKADDPRHQARLAIALAGVQRHYTLADAPEEFARRIAPVATDIENRFGDEYQHTVPESQPWIDARIALLDAYFAHLDHENARLRYHLARLLQVRAGEGDLTSALAHADKATEGLDSFSPWVLLMKIAWSVRGDKTVVDIADEALKSVRDITDDSNELRHSFYALPAVCLNALGESRAAVEELKRGHRRISGKNRYRLAEAAVMYAAADHEESLLDEAIQWLQNEPGTPTRRSATPEKRPRSTRRC